MNMSFIFSFPFLFSFNIFCYYNFAMYLASYFLAHANICSPNTRFQVIKAITFEKMFLSLFLCIYIHIPVFATAYFMKIRNKYTNPFLCS